MHTVSTRQLHMVFPGPVFPVGFIRFQRRGVTMRSSSTASKLSPLQSSLPNRIRGLPKTEKQKLSYRDNAGKHTVATAATPTSILLHHKKLSPQEYEQIIVDNRDHGERLARSLLNRWRVRLSPDDIASIVGLALCEAASRFDKTKGVHFRTFLFYHLRGMLIKEIVRLVEEQKVYHTTPDPGTDGGINFLPQNDCWPIPVVETKTPETIVQRQQLAALCAEGCAELDELEREVIVRAYIMDQPLNSIAKELKYCRCHISRVKSRALKTLLDFLKGRLPEVYFMEHASNDAEGRSTQPKRSSSSLKRTKRSYKGGRGRRKLLSVGHTK